MSENNPFASMTESFQVAEGQVQAPDPVAVVEPVVETPAVVPPVQTVVETPVPEPGTQEPVAVVETPPAAEPVPPVVKPVQEPPQLSAEEQQAQQVQQYNEAHKLLKAEYLKQLDGDDFVPEQKAMMAHLAATQQLESQRMMMNFLGQIAPNYITQAINQNTQMAQYEKDFFSAWPGLEKEEYRKSIVDFVTVLRNRDSQATPESIINQVGAAVCGAHQLNPIEVAKSQGTGAPTPVKPSPQIPLRSVGGGTPPPVVVGEKDNPASADFYSGLVDKFDPVNF